MRNNKDLSRMFSKGQQLEGSLSTSSIFSKDSGLHLTGYAIQVNGKSTVIDNMSVFGNVVLVLESKNFTLIEGDYSKKFWVGRGISRHFRLPNPIDQNKYHVALLRAFLIEQGMSPHEFVIEHYVVVPDKCKIAVDTVARTFVQFQAEIELLKKKLAFYNKKENEQLVKIIKEGLT